MGMVGPVLGRDILAIVFLLTAAWKVTHAGEYANSFTRLRPEFIRAFEPLARTGLGCAELACVILLAAGPALGRGAAEAGPVLAIVLLVTFTVAVARQRSAVGCGCWSAPVTGPGGSDVKGPLLARNAILLAVSLVAAIPVRADIPAGLLLSAAALSAVVAPVMLELPQVIAVTKYQGGMRVGGARF